MSETIIQPTGGLSEKIGLSETLSLIMGAGGLTLGIGAFASLLSISLNEFLYQYINADLSKIQYLTYSLFELAMALFLIWPILAQLLQGSRKTLWVMASVSIGMVLAVWLSPSVMQVWSPGLIAAPSEKTVPNLIFFGSPAAHATLWVLHAILITAVAEALLFQGYMFHALRSLPAWLVCFAVLFFYCMAGAYELGFDGMWNNLKLGSVLVVLRLAGGSFVYSAIAGAIYRGIDQAAIQWLTFS